MKKYITFKLLKNFQLTPNTPKMTIDINGIVRYFDTGELVPTIKLSDGLIIEDNDEEMYFIHDIMVDLFIMDSDDRQGGIVLHLDGDKSNNKFKNLKVGFSY